MGFILTGLNFFSTKVTFYYLYGKGPISARFRGTHLGAIVVVCFTLSQIEIPY